MLVVTRSKFHEVINLLKRSTHLSVDTETTGLSYFHDDCIFSIIVSSDFGSFYFNYNLNSDIEDKYILDRRDIPFFNNVFTDEKVVFMANAKFDMHMLDKEGVEIKSKIWDVLIVDKCLRNTELRYSLEAVARRNGYEKDLSVEEHIQKHRLYTKVDQKTSSGKSKSKKIPHYNLVPFDMIVAYGIKDAAITYDIGQKQMQEVQSIDLEHMEYGWPSFWEVVERESDVIKVCFRLEKRGIKIRSGFIHSAIGEETKRIKKSEDSYYQYAGQAFVDSAKSLGKSFDLLDIVGGTTAKGNRSFTDEILRKIEHPIAEAVRVIREANKKIYTYYQSFLSYADKDETLHCSIRIAGADTFRFSITDPALQTIPTDSEDAEFKVRDSFEARDGYKLFSIDYKFEEYALMADYAGEMELIERLNRGEDIHQATADMMGVDRKTAKCIAEDSLVLTDKGNVKIQDITLDHKVWDGYEFVTHSGVVFNGVKEVMKYEGIEATEDHIIYTGTGRKVPIWLAASKYANEGAMVSEAPHNGIRDNNFRPSEFFKDEEKRGYVRWRLFGMWENKNYSYSEYSKGDDKILRLPVEGTLPTNPCYKTIERSLPSCEATMRESKQPVLGELWGEGYKSISILWRFFRFLFIKLFSGRYFGYGNRSNRQQWELRDRKFKVGASSDKSSKQEIESLLQLRRRANKLHRFMGAVKEGLSRLFIILSSNFQARSRELQRRRHLIPKTKRKVYDIQNCGPRFQYTVNGKLVKNCMNFMLLYGGGRQKLADALGISVTEAGKLKDKYFSSLPKVKELMSSVSDVAVRRGFIFNFAGRRLSFQDRSLSYKATNALIQSTGAEVMRLALVKMEKFLEGKKTRILLSIHDEIVGEVHESELDLIPQLQEIMSSVYPSKNGIKLLTSVSIGQTWGEL